MGAAGAVFHAPSAGHRVAASTVGKQAFAAAHEQHVEFDRGCFTGHLDLNWPGVDPHARLTQHLQAQQVVQCSTIHPSIAGEIIGDALHEISEPLLPGRFLHFEQLGA
ncbi:MAG: hypothetical protein EON92_05180 [Burkholderiales bacterium]|nr:MAG: hypothetical protein EON92_05180 [Burkholderiales bacterium]